MVIGITSNHGGVELKKYIINNSMEIQKLVGEELIINDFGTNSTESSDYPDFASRIAEEYLEGNIQKGILICKSGHGMCIAVNKFRGIRGSLANSVDSIINGTRDDDLNMLCLSSNDVDGPKSLNIISAFLKTKFLNEGNYKRRKEKLLKIEEKNLK